VNEPLAILLDAANSSSEWWNFALGALELLISGAVLAVAGNIYSHRREREIKVDGELASLRAENVKLKERLGAEIVDVKLAVAPVFQKLDLPNPSYPTR
jgi:hypothetical protein